jgi:hypothetical protein
VGLGEENRGFWCGNLKEGDLLEGRRIIFKRIFKK